MAAMSSELIYHGRVGFGTMVTSQHRLVVSTVIGAESSPKAALENLPVTGTGQGPLP